MIAPIAKPYTPRVGASTSAPAMMPRLYIDGARPGSQKLLMRVQNAHHHAADAEDDGRDEQEPHQLDGELLHVRR